MLLNTPTGWQSGNLIGVTGKFSSSLTPVVLLLDAIQLKLGVDTFIVLIGVPLLVTLMMYLSIDSFIKKKNI